VTGEPGAEEEIRQYNQFAAGHEQLIAKSLFSAALTWRGVVAFDVRGPVGRRREHGDADGGGRSHRVLVLNNGQDPMSLCMMAAVAGRRGVECARRAAL
jgi:hypothetical protein